MDRSCTPYISQEEQIIIMEGYEEYKMNYLIKKKNINNYC